MKKITMILIVLMMTMVSAFATPRLEGNKIYLDEAKTSKFTVEEFIADAGGEEALDIPDDFGHTKRMQLEVFCNPNKVIEFATEELATVFYNTITSIEIQPGDLYCIYTDCCETLDFYLYMLMLDKYGVTPVYLYVENL